MRISDWSSDVCSSDLSFRTQETLLNGAVLRDWLGASGLERLYAVSSRPDAAVAFGVPERQVLAMAETVGGRYSLWSTVGFAIALALGMDGFRALLTGEASSEERRVGQGGFRTVKPRVAP